MAGGDARSAAAEAFRYKSEIEERDDTIEVLRREIRALGKEHVPTVFYAVGSSQINGLGIQKNGNFFYSLNMSNSEPPTSPPRKKLCQVPPSTGQMQSSFELYITLKVT